MPGKLTPLRGQTVPWWAALVFGILAAVAVKRPLSPAGSVLSPASSDGKSADEAKAGPAAGRGRSADAPSEVPASGWWDILKRVYADFGNNRLLAVAASVTFYALLAIFPAIVALVSLYGLFADPSTISEHLTALSGLMPGGALDVIGEQVKRIASKPRGSLGFGTIVGLGTALWSANAGMKAMFDALNIVYEEKEKRNFIVLNATSLIFTIGAIAFLMLAMASVVLAPIIFNFGALGHTMEIILGIARWPILLVLVVLTLAVLYRYAPSRQKPQWRWVTWGSGFSAIAWIVASMLFSWYVSKFGSYNETYGSLGAAIGFLTWIWISTTIVLLGAEINAETEHQTAKDTTVGDGKPMGTRGATKADHVAAA